MTEVSTQELERCSGLLADLKAQERKLMEKYYRDEISAELFSEESSRIKRERVDATAIVSRLGLRHDQLENALALVLALLSAETSTICGQARSSDGSSTKRSSRRLGSATKMSRTQTSSSRSMRSA